MVGWRLLLATVFVAWTLLPTVHSAHAGSAAKTALPGAVISSGIESRGSSRDPSVNATIFYQTIKFEPRFPVFSLAGLSVKTSLLYSARLDGSDYPGGGGKARSEYAFTVAGQDLYKRIQFGASFTEKLPLAPGGTGGSILRADPTSEQKASMRFNAPAGPTVTANIARSTSGSVYAGKLATGSEYVTGNVVMQYGLPHGMLKFTRNTSESQNVLAGTRRSTESTQLNFDHAAPLPLGTLKTTYSFKETRNNLLTLPGEINTMHEENVKVGLESGKALGGAVDYSASAEQRRTTLPDGRFSDRQTQKCSVGVKLPLPGSGTGRAGVSITESQDENPPRSTATSTVKYSLSLRPTPELGLNVDSSTTGTSDLATQSRRNETGALSGRLSYNPHDRFGLTAAVSETTSRDYTGSGSERSRTTISATAQMKAKKFGLNFQLGDTTSQDVSNRLFGDREDDSYFASANLNYLPTPKMTVNATFRSSIFHNSPENRDITQTLNLVMSYSLSSNVSWNFIYRGDDRWTRAEPDSGSFGDTIQTNFTFRF